MPVIAASAMTANAKVHGTPAAPPPGLSPLAQSLWLTAVRYRRLADELAASDRGMLSL